MIVDDFIEKDKTGYFLDLHTYHVVKVPYSLGVRFNDIGMMQFLDELVEKLTPIKKVEIDGEVINAFDAKWGRSPYRCVVIYSTDCSKAIMTLTSEVSHGIERWITVLYIQMIPGIVAIPITTAINIEGDILGTKKFLEDFWLGVYKVTALISGESVAKWWVQACKDNLTYAVDNDGQKIPHICGDLVRIALTTTSLMNAKNIINVPNVPDKKLQTARIKRGKLPLMIWHELKLTPFKKIYKSGGTCKTDELIPLHWVRGHFKVFSKEKPLFGKFSGRYWWQPHIAGTDETRFVKKDYRIVV